MTPPLRSTSRPLAATLASRRLSATAVLSAALSAVLLSACAGLGDTSRSALSAITPYRIEIVQGNVVTREMAAAVRPGMSRAQVRDILGTPLLDDIFHPARWDYVFTIQRAGAAEQRRTVTAHFDGDRLSRLHAPDDLPSELEFVSQVAPQRGSRRAPVLSLTPEQIADLPTVQAPEPAGSLPPITPPSRTFPPLEPGS